MTITILTGCCLTLLQTLPDKSVHTCITSPPYFGLRNYDVEGQIGLEPSPAEFVDVMVRVFREVRRVLRDDGTVWLNLGDSYAGSGRGGYVGGKSGLEGSTEGQDQSRIAKGSQHPAGLHESARHAGAIGRAWVPPPNGLKPKDLIGIPWRVAFALQDDGWYLRSDIIWSKPNPMPESVTDRPTKSHENLFMLSKNERYYYDHRAIAEPCDWNPDDTKLPDGWDSGPGSHGSFHRAGRERGAKVKRSGNKARKPGSKRGWPEGTGSNICGSVPWEGTTRNKRSVWTVSTKPFTEAHFATYPPELIEPCILAGCPPEGKRCDCDEVIHTPTGSGDIDDPSLTTGRAGMNRPRREDEGTRPITRREQRGYAEQMKSSPHREEMRAVCGSAFDHYVRTDRSGARPLPESVLRDFLARGWLSEPPSCDHPVEPAGTVLDPFFGAGTTGLVADRHGRNCIGIELNESYVQIAERRLRKDAGMFADIVVAV